MCHKITAYMVRNNVCT